MFKKIIKPKWKMHSLRPFSQLFLDRQSCISKKKVNYKIVDIKIFRAGFTLVKAIKR